MQLGSELVSSLIASEREFDSCLQFLLNNTRSSDASDGNVIDATIHGSISCHPKQTPLLSISPTPTYFLLLR